MADSIYEEILDELVAHIQALSLTDIDSTSIVERKVPWDRYITKPAVLVTPLQETRNHFAGTNETDETVYRVLLTVYQDSNQDQDSNFARFLEWRQDITRSLENQVALTDIEEVIKCTVDPGPVFERTMYMSGYDCQSMIVNVTAREGRT